MRCRATTSDGVSHCTRTREFGSRYCWQHRRMWGYLEDDSAPEITQERTTAPLVPVVTPSWVAAQLAATDVPDEHKRAFATELSEAYLLVNSDFNVRGFIHTALNVPAVTRS